MTTLTTEQEQELKRELCERLPEQIGFAVADKPWPVWIKEGFRLVQDTELLHICWLVEQDLEKKYGGRSVKNLHRSFLIELVQICNPDVKFTDKNLWDEQFWINCISAPWQSRARAIVATKKNV